MGEGGIGQAADDGEMEVVVVVGVGGEGIDHKLGFGGEEARGGEDSKW